MYQKQILQLSLPVLLLALLARYLLGRSHTTEPMPAPPSPRDVASALLAENGLDVLSLSLLQSLWAGYGQICRVTAAPKHPPPDSNNATAKDSAVSTPKNTHSYVLKLISPPSSKRGDEGHIRKILSYQIEQYFYTELAPQLPATIPVAKCLASINEQQANGSSTTAMILSDLAQDYPIAGEKRAALTPTQALSALDWLSNFHGFWWPRITDFNPNDLVLPPLEQSKRKDTSGLSIWLNGGYTYLATRLSEYSSLVEDSDSEWSEALTQPLQGHKQSIAELVASFLSPSASDATAPIESYQTLIHGDVKSENLFTSADGDQVAFYDFQYVGLGLGVCDLAKFFTCSVPLDMLVADRYVPDVLEMGEGESQLLERYWKNLREVGRGREYDWELFVRHWEVALVDWLRFQASWGFWGNTEWLEARVRSILKDQGWKEFLVRATSAQR